MMKIFFKKIFTFIGSLYLLLIISVVGTRYIINKNANFKLQPNINKIILGNSQPECAYNDTLITNFKNLSKSGETYFYNYQKLKALIAQNPQIDTVFIEFSNINILEREDEKIWTNRFIMHHLPNYNNLLHWKDYELIIAKNPVGTQKAILASLKTNSERIMKQDYNYTSTIGGYLYLKREKVNAILDTIQNDKIKQTKNVRLSTSDLEYLDKMILICKNNNITPYLIRSPYHPKFQAEKYDSIFNNIIHTKYASVPFIDFKTFPLNDSDYGDLQHLNHKGATKFSKHFNEIIK